jgi:hypothetical protein
MINFRGTQERFIQFLEDNYKNYLPEYLADKNIEYVDDFLDFDQYKNDFTMFIDFSKIDFRNGGYDDDCHKTINMEIEIYIVRRNNKSKILRADTLDAASSFCRMILSENSYMDLALNANINSIDFYNYVEGNKNLVCAEISLSLTV